MISAIEETGREGSGNTEKEEKSGGSIFRNQNILNVMGGFGGPTR